MVRVSLLVSFVCSCHVLLVGFGYSLHKFLGTIRFLVKKQQKVLEFEIDAQKAFIGTFRRVWIEAGWRSLPNYKVMVHPDAMY